MSNLAVVPPADPKEKPAKVSSKPGPPLIPVVAGAAVLGLTLGALVLGPMVGGRSAAGAGTEEKHKKSAKHGKEDAVDLMEIKNIVVNPAGSEGEHYIMATVSLEIHDKESQEWMQEHQHIVRDVILSTLGKETLQSLSNPGARDEMKKKIAEALGALHDGAGDMTVYLPEFVVQ